MRHWLTMLALLLPLSLSFSLPLQATEQCLVEPAARRGQQGGPWIDRDNWLAPHNLRIGLQSPDRFMPLRKISTKLPPEPLPAAPAQLELEKISVTDPLDEQQRDLAFLLDTRLYADGLVVLRNGKLVSERYWNGLPAQQPRLLLDATRPLLSLMGAIAVARGKLSPDKSVIRYIPALNSQAGLRKLSVQRLLEGSSRFAWSAQEIDDWQAAGGWRPGRKDGIRAWLGQPQRWERDFSDDAPAAGDAGPDADLLTWALAETYREPLANIFCENVLGRLRPENPVLWLTDPQGTELSDGLAMSLRDLARLGQMMIETRNSTSRSKIPNWFIETLTASGGLRKADAPELAGLKKGSESRYGFVHLGGAPNRVAILGPYGNSLYVDFDRRLVIALFAAYPSERSAAMLALLEQTWETLASATQSPARR